MEEIEVCGRWPRMEDTGDGEICNEFSGLWPTEPTVKLGLEYWGVEFDSSSELLIDYHYNLESCICLFMADQVYAYTPSAGLGPEGNVNTASKEEWPAEINAHRTLFRELPLLFQAYPYTAESKSRYHFATKYGMPARMWTSRTKPVGAYDNLSFQSQALEILSSSIRPRNCLKFKASDFTELLDESKLPIFRLFHNILGVMRSRAIARTIRLLLVLNFFSCASAMDRGSNSATTNHFFACFRNENLILLTTALMVLLAGANILLYQDGSPSALLARIINQTVWVPTAGVYYKNKIWGSRFAELTLIFVVLLSGFMVQVFQPGLEGVFTFYPISFSLLAIGIASLSDVRDVCSSILLFVGSFLVSISTRQQSRQADDQV